MNSQNPLAAEEYIEQAYFFRSLRGRISENIPTQDLLKSVREEILATTKLPIAIDFMLDELKHAGAFGPAMRKLSHYFTSFQSYVVGEAEDERGRFDLRVALEILQREAEYRSADYSPQGLFLYQFESLCRNRLGYQDGLEAMAEDPAYDQAWQEWIHTVRRQVGIIDIADLVYVESEYYRTIQTRQGPSTKSASATVSEGGKESGNAREPEDDGESEGDRESNVNKDSTAKPRKPLFGEREGRIALANRKKDPLYLFASFHRQLGYPEVPRQKPANQQEELLPQLARRLERLETRFRLLEEEQRGGIDLSKFYQPPKD